MLARACRLPHDIGRASLIGIFPQNRDLLDWRSRRAAAFPHGEIHRRRHALAARR